MTPIFLQKAQQVNNYLYPFPSLTYLRSQASRHLELDGRETIRTPDH